MPITSRRTFFSYVGALLGCFRRFGTDGVCAIDSRELTAAAVTKQKQFIINSFSGQIYIYRGDWPDCLDSAKEPSFRVEALLGSPVARQSDGVRPTGRRA